MFNKEFFPTPEDVVYTMINGYDVSGKVIWEPSAGKGNIIDVLKKERAAEIIACESNLDLQKILSTKARIIASDCMTVKSDQISHIHMIIMNPPFSAAIKHINYMWDIAPAGCVILALCNSSNISDRYSSYRQDRQAFKELIEENGSYQDIGNCFNQAERETDVSVSVVRLHKPSSDYKAEFNGFFEEDDQPERQENGIMSYNVVRDLVNRYVAAIKLFDEQLELGIKMENLVGEFYGSCGSFAVTQDGKPKARADFKKEMQKEGWKYIFEKMNMQKHMTRQLREDINKFVEQQTRIPFTMRNIYAMLQLVVGTHSQRMDKVLEEVFDKLTKHHDENRYHVEGWKTNSHYLVNRKFIFPYGCNLCKYMKTINVHSGTEDLLDDLDKALCYITGRNYDTVKGIRHYYRSHPEAGQWYETDFFRIKFYKKGTIHCEFRSEDVWANFNQRVAKLRGYPLPESKKESSFKGKKEAERRNAETAKHYHPPVKQQERQSNKLVTLFNDDF